MRHPKWIGIAPNNIFWSPDSKTLNFYWNPEGALSDSLYSITLQNSVPRKTTLEERRNSPARFGRYNKANTQMTYEKNGDIFLYDIPSGKISQITNTVSQEFGPYFSGDERKIIFTIGHDAYSWEISTGKFTQLTNFEKGSKPATIGFRTREMVKKRSACPFPGFERKGYQTRTQTKEQGKPNSPRNRK